MGCHDTVCSRTQKCLMRCGLNHGRTGEGLEGLWERHQEAEEMGRGGEVFRVRSKALT